MKLNDTNKKYTIKDIAKLAGVSKGTVDRVLHKRGKVSQKAFDKVDAVLKEIDYVPNPIARSLKNNKTFKIHVLIPDPAIDAYWLPAHEGIETAIKQFESFGIKVRKFFYHPHNTASFVQTSKSALQETPDGLLMAAFRTKEALQVLNTCKRKNITLVSFNNVIDGLHHENFIGQDLFQSGRVAASLIDKMPLKSPHVGIVHINEEPHMKEKEKGFRSYMEEKKSNLKIVTYTFSDDSKSAIKKTASMLLEFEVDKDISALFVTNSKAHVVVEKLKQTKQHKIVVGYDLVQENINCLNAGDLQFLIHQKPQQQAYLGICYLADYFLFEKAIPSQELLPIDIITTENLKYYLS